MVAMMHVFVLPPRESLSNLVNLLSLKPRNTVRVIHLIVMGYIRKDNLIENNLIPPVRNMTRVFNKSINNTAKSEQTFIYLSCLPCSTL